ncbi:YfiT family bacillithiol transferase [Galbibacter pacificus]|uniref:Bacillithiol transferase BstA n=1 Tax=Galbibacter pacificus TaxID=2996052 RepID=A0ABT6FVF5_9FLAO|nr:bacillithiol transferase BstA [Galbibacter pacificus]MDG3583829.1 bacillithiol transferase BstA [Galbibacter pacificus]MDG3587253.1 bacillithiol transferase BstA [Galbibacter pacificus]
MTTEALEKLKYPIGKFTIPDNITSKDIQKWIKTIEFFPDKLESLVEDFDDLQLDTPYRPGGWTVRQVIHHLADSHINSYVRFKWTLTEEKPTIKAYHEDRWALLDDGAHADIDLSLSLIESLHKRWAYMLKDLTAKQLNRTFIHPESKAEISLKQLIGIYDWHCRHHFAHIKELAKREDWV